MAASYQGKSLSAALPVLRAYLPVLLLSAAIPALLCLLWLIFRAPVYQSTLIMSVAFHADNEDVSLHASKDSRELATLSELFRSPVLIRRAMSDLDLHRYPEFSADASEQERQFLQRLVVEPVPETRLLRLQFRAQDPSLAPDALDSLAAVFVRWTEEQYHRFVEIEAMSVRRTLQLFLHAAGTEIASAQIPDSGGDLLYLPVGNDVVELRDEDLVIARLLEHALVESLMTGFRATVASHARVTPIDSAAQPVNLHAGFAFELPVFVYLLALMLASMLLLLWHNNRQSLALPDELLRLTHLPLVANLPAVDPEQFRVLSESCSLPSDSRYLEAIRRFRSALCLRARHTETGTDELAMLALGRKGTSVLTTSALDGDGKSSVALALALSLGQVERVLLINADLRASSQPYCGLPADAPGLSHLIAGAAPLRRCVHTLRAEGIDVMPAGIRPPNPQELLSSRRFARIMDMLSRRYQYIIIDGPSAGLDSDLQLLQTYCTETLFVVRANVTPRSAVRAALDELSSHTGVRLLLNAVEPDQAKRFGLTSLFPDLPAERRYDYQKPGGRFLAES